MKAPGRIFLLVAGILLMVFGLALILWGLLHWLFGFVIDGRFGGPVAEFIWWNLPNFHVALYDLDNLHITDPWYMISRFRSFGIINMSLGAGILLVGIFGTAWHNRPKRGLALVILASVGLVLTALVHIYVVPLAALAYAALLTLYIIGGAMNMRFGRWQPQALPPQAPTVPIAPVAPSGLKPFCNVCGAKNVHLIAYCHNCGNPLKEIQ